MPVDLLPCPRDFRRHGCGTRDPKWSVKTRAGALFVPAALERHASHVGSHDDAWTAERVDIARHWRAVRPG